MSRNGGEPRSGRILRIPICLCLVVLLVVSAVSFSQQQEKVKQRITLQNLFATGIFRPLPAQIRWLPDGKGFIYTYRGGLWRYDLGGEPTELTKLAAVTSKLMEGRERHGAADDTNATGRFDRSAMSLSPDGKHLLGFENNDLYLYNIETGEAGFVTNDPEPEMFQVFSPDNTRIAYVKGREIFVLDLAGGDEKQLTRSENEEVWNGVADWVYEEEFAVRQAFCWSPDSQKIAYLQFDTRPIKYFYIIDHLQIRPEPEKQKYPLTGEDNSIVKLGVVGASGGDTVWVGMGEEKDYYVPRLAWNHSGSAVVYHWLNRPQNRLEFRFADPNSGESRAVVIEESDSWVNFAGNWLNPSADAIFLSDDSFVWASERTGFRHLYHYGADGQLKTQLTSGDWMVETLLSVSGVEKTVYFIATEQSPLERHVYSVGIDGAGFKRLTPEKGTHTATFSPTGGHFVRFYSAAAVPTQVAVFATDGALVKTLDDGVVPSLKNFAISYPEFLTVKSEDGVDLNAMMIKPPDFDPAKKYPVIVYTYGGPGVQTVTDTWGFVVGILNIFASRDYIVFALDNRGSWGRGLAFESKIYRRVSEWEVKDQVAGAKYLQSLPYVDGENIGVTGGSYGGYMSVMLLLRAPEYFKAGVAQSPGTALEHYDTIYTERYMGTPQDNPEGYANANPGKYASGLKGHLYIMHGLMDNNVHVQGIIQMVDDLIRAGKDFKFMLYPQERHGINTPYRFTHQWNTLLAFFDEHLK